MKKLGFGCMRLPLINPEDPTSVDIEQFSKMIDTFIENGFTYFDTAYPYHQKQSELFVKKALVERYPRDSYTLADKLPVPFMKVKEDAQKIFYEQLEKCGVEYFDYYLLHSLNRNHYQTALKFDCFEFIKKMKEEGKIKEIGFSFHDTAEILDQILTEHPEMDFVQLQINYLDWNSDSVQSKLCYETAVKHGKKVVIMEPVKGGSLVHVPEDVKTKLFNLDNSLSVASWAIRFAASLKNVRVVLSGMSNLEQLYDNISYMKEFKPLTQEENKFLIQLGDQIRTSIAIPCTACNYCTPGCPKNICIPEYFSLYNKRKQTLSKDKSDEYDNLKNEHGKPLDCIECGQCERVCPQKLLIISNLKKVAEEFE